MSELKINGIKVPTEGDIIQFNDGQWQLIAGTEINVNLANETLSSIGDVVYGSPLEADQILAYNGTNWTNTNIEPLDLGDLGDVDITGSPLPQDGDVLTYDSGNWVHQANSSGSGNAIFKRVSARIATQQVFSTAGPTAIQWDEEGFFDTYNLHDPVSDNTRIYTPDGVSLVCGGVKIYVRTMTMAQIAFLKIVKNGNEIVAQTTFQTDVSVDELKTVYIGFIKYPYYENGDSIENPFQALMSNEYAWERMQTTPGDYFEVQIELINYPGLGSPVIIDDDIIVKPGDTTGSPITEFSAFELTFFTI